MKFVTNDTYVINNFFILMQKINKISLSYFLSKIYIKWLNKELQLLLITDQVCVRPVSQVMMLQDHHSHQLSADQSTKTSWLAWIIKKSMLEKKLKPRRVSSSWTIPSSMVSSTTGTIWPKSGITASTMNSELLHLNIHASWLKVIV